MARASKPYAVLVGEGISHRTKAELESRKEAEQAALTGVDMREQPAVRDDPVAHKCYTRIHKLMKSIGKSDAIYEIIINRYCALFSEVCRAEEERRKLEKRMDTLEEWLKTGECRYDEFTKTAEALTNQIIATDRNLQTKRKMMLDIEKECMMTVAAALRAIPKKPDEEKPDPMADMLARRHREI